MTSAQKKNLTANKRRYLADIATIDRVIREIAMGGTATATLSAGGASRSYSSIDVQKLLALRNDYASRVSAINRAIENSSPAGKRTIRIVRW